MMKLFSSGNPEGILITCSKCGEAKTANMFNVDSNSSNGLSSYCKECNAKHAKEWRESVVQSDKRDNDTLVELYRQAYVEGYYKSTAAFETSRRRDARNYANSLFPEAGRAIEEYTLYTRQKGKIPMTPKIQLGNTLMHNLRGLIPKVSKGRQKSSNPIITSDESSSSKSHQGSFLRKYETWIADNDFIPPDDFLAHFCGVTAKHIIDTRSDFRKAGYEIEQTTVGWKVTKRPQKMAEKNLDDLSPDELKALLKRLVANL